MKKLIKNVSIFDGQHTELKKGHHLIIENNFVKEIAAGEVSEDNFTEIIDGRNLTAMPGMIDCHVHLGHLFGPESSLDYNVAVSAAIAKKILLNGFTTVRDAGGVVQGLKKAFDQKILAGPRIFPSNSAITQTCGHGDMESHALRRLQYEIPTFSVLADGVPEVMRAVREQFYKGASQIKIMAGGGCTSIHDPLQTIQFSYEEMKAAVDTAKDYGTYVMAHLYTPLSMARAARAGVKSFEHAHMMDEESARIIESEGIFVAPMGQFSKTPPENKKQEMVLAREAYATDLLNKYRIRILFGTDLMIYSAKSEPDQGMDLSIYKKRFGNFRALLSATGNAYELFQMSSYQNPYPDGKLGVLEPGSYADLLLVDGNPVENVDFLADAENIKLIMKDGEVYKNILQKQSGS